jgi:hypothetical protein
MTRQARTVTTPEPEDDLAGRLTRYRRVREQIERHILPLATSVDGSGFELQAPLHDLRLRRGGYVSLTIGNEIRLGRIDDLGVATIDAGESMGSAGRDVRVRLVQGSGVLLEESAPFHDAAVRPATPDEVGAWCARNPPRNAGLVVGELLRAPGVSAVLDVGGLNRHTFLCGQSGSGKTYALGLLLERVLAETSLRVVVLDPNSDYVGLPRPRAAADARSAARYADVPAQVAVWREDPAASHVLRLRFADLDSATQAAVLDLDPIRDRDEYAHLVELLHRQERGRPLVTGLDQLLESDVPAARALGLRAMNLGVLEWGVWGPDQPSVVEELRRPTTRCTVIDLGSLATTQEQRLVAQAALTALWESRMSRTPCLVVVDEAHNVCPGEATDRVTRLSAERAVQVAAEGRKYGLFLLTSTQRPHKVHENVVSQCDNLVLMRMNSRADLADLASLFSFVPEGLMAGASSFRQGEALIAGRVLPRAAYVRMGERVSEEGGADLPLSWATPRDRT